MLECTIGLIQSHIYNPELRLLLKRHSDRPARPMEAAVLDTRLHRDSYGLRRHHHAEIDSAARLLNSLLGLLRDHMQV